MCLITLVLLPILGAFSIRVNDEGHGDMARFDVDRPFPAYWTRNDGELFSPPGKPRDSSAWRRRTGTGTPDASLCRVGGLIPGGAGGLCAHACPPSHLPDSRSTGLPTPRPSGQHVDVGIDRAHRPPAPPRDLSLPPLPRPSYSPGKHRPLRDDTSAPLRSRRPLRENLSRVSRNLLPLRERLDTFGERPLPPGDALQR